MISILGQNIKRVRESKKISAYKLAQISGVGNSTISQIESGKRQTLNVSTIEKLATALNVEPNKLISPEDDTEYELTDFKEIISTILLSADITLDEIELTDIEKKDISLAIEIAIQLIRNRRDPKTNK